MIDDLEDAVPNLQMDKVGRRTSVNQQKHRAAYVGRVWQRQPGRAQKTGLGGRAHKRADALLRKF